MLLLLLLFADWEVKVPELFQPVQAQHIAIDSEGTVIVPRLSQGDLARIDYHGQPLPPLGGRGQGPGEFYAPLWVTSHGESHIYAWDQMHRAYNVFTGDSFERKIKIPSGLISILKVEKGWLKTEGISQRKLFLTDDAFGNGYLLLEGPTREPGISFDRTKPRLLTAVSRDNGTVYAHTPKDGWIVIHIIDVSTRKVTLFEKEVPKIPIPDGWQDPGSRKAAEILGRKSDAAEGYFPPVSKLVKGPMNLVLVYGSNDYLDPNAAPIVLDDHGVEQKVSFSASALARLIEIRDGKAWLTTCDGDGFGIARVPIEVVNDFVTNNPLVLD